MLRIPAKGVPGGRLDERSEDSPNVVRYEQFLRVYRAKRSYVSNDSCERGDGSPRYEECNDWERGEEYVSTEQ
eukprot:8865295-Pyramimonas_sp.AAC.1